MLTPDQEDSLLISLFATAETMGQELTEAAGLMMVQDLKGYEEPAIAAALQACRRELTGKLTIAAILQRVQEVDGRPGRDEAWSIALQAGDESDTVVLTGEILAALQVARPLLAARDKVGARMAFISAYDRLVADARRESKPAKWEVSIGFDPQLRARAIEQARDLKRLPAPEADRLLLQYTQEIPTGNGQAIAGLLTGAVGAPDPATREKLQAIRKDLVELRRRSLVQRRWDRRREKRAARARKEAFIKRAAELQAQQEVTV
ncbi:hypothetical protein FQZ97_757980 [compost metagenome]